MTNNPTAAPDAASSQDGEPEATEVMKPQSADASEAAQDTDTEPTKKKKKSRRRRRGGRSSASEDTDENTDSSEQPEGDGESSTKKKKEEEESVSKKASTRKTTRKSSKKTTRKSDTEADSKTEPETETETETETGTKTETETETATGTETETETEAGVGAETGDDAGTSSSNLKTKKIRKKTSSSSTRYRRPDRLAIEVTPIGPTCEAGARTMIIDSDYSEECRIAFMENDILEEFFLERRTSATSVGNIYKARVSNVESAIQAAFVDYGQSQNGFLHVSDLHPRYFPGGEKTERVGRKTPRRERPPIQDALKKGQEILVQVLKQGVGTKGPTLTSYLSIPGRLLVMMPGMDRVGVSRKVENDEQRREMRRVLDELDLPEGFGFILRTAGFEHSKTDLKRDIAYLQRLWKQMEKRRLSVGAPAELYTEGDLLVRSIRDLVDGSIGKIITNDRQTFETTRNFLSVVAPRSSPPVLYYDGDVPLFEKFGVEKQVDQIHSREVTLKSGGALVIDQTEALVAVDVNSGRSRAARDSETNALNTNSEAVDEIARQLRLRDLGGLVICDLIDMRIAKNRKTIEDRLAENLRRDRARTTFLPISEFGILEMTRQRMRPSMRSLHFSPCTSCKGIGELRSPDSIGADAIRRAAWLLAMENVRRVEIVCSARSASSLLSTYRRRLDQIERPSSKRVDVRISDTIGLDDFNVYAYDERNADIDVSRIPRSKTNSADELLEELPEINDSEMEFEKDSGGPSRGRRRRKRKPAIADAASVAFSGGFDLPEEDEEDEEETKTSNTSSEDSNESKDDDALAEGGKKRRRRRRRRRRRGGSEETSENEDAALPEATATVVSENTEPIRVHILAKELAVPSKEILELCRQKLELDVKTHMSSIPAEAIERIRSLIAGSVAIQPEEATEADSEHQDSGEDGEPRKKRRRRRRRRGRRGGGGGEGGEGSEGGEGGSESNSGQNTEAAAHSTSMGTSHTDAAPEKAMALESGAESEPSQSTPAKPKRRSLYGSQRRRVPPTAVDHKDDR